MKKQHTHPSALPRRFPLESGMAVLYVWCLLLFSTLGFATTPPGTVINNTANIQYQVNSLSQPPLHSNTDTFTVLEANNLNQGHVTPSGLDEARLFSGTTVSFNIEVQNEGTNNLNNGTLSIRLAEALDFELTDPNATLQSQTTLNGFTTYQYAIAPLLIASTASYAAHITWPANTQVNSDTLNIAYQANGVEVADSTTTLNLGERTQGVLQLLQYSAESDATSLVISPTEFLQSNNIYTPLTPPIIEDLGISVTAAPIPVKPATIFTHKQVVFVKLEEGDHNLNRTLRETVEVDFTLSENGETEHLKLMETSENSGVFTGYITLHANNTVVAYNGELDVVTNARVNINYTDDIDHNDSTSDIILVDPYGILFDSSTGALLNGYTVSMVNADTGQPAQVFGDDGISSYPATVITGGSVTDSSGTVYNFDNGAYRFPFAPTGNYKLVVTPPANSTYTWPSQQATELINQLPDAPYAITLGSRGEIFPLRAGPPLHIDIPLDRSSNPLYIQRTANVNHASPGDFILFKVQVENADSVPLEQVRLTDTLPQGFRLEPDSVTLNGQAISPTLSGNGQTLTFPLNSLATGEVITIEYVVAVGAIHRGNAYSHSLATANNGAAQSNTATVKTWITEALMRSRAILMGQIIVHNDSNQADLPNGLKGIRIYMEDGRYAITDERGQYHFDNVTPGNHIVQLDLDTLPPQYEAILEENNTRFSGRAWSQFIEVQGGTLWRSDFHVREKPKPQGNLSLQLQHSPLIKRDQLQYTVSLKNQTVALTNRRLTVMIPKQMDYQAGSAQLNGQPVSDPKITGNMLTFQLGNTQGKSHATLQFLVNGLSRQTSPEIVSKAFLTFNTPSKNNQRTPVATYATIINHPQSTQRVFEKMVLPIRFRSANDQLSVQDKQALARFANKIKSLKNIQIHAVGHSDNRTLLPETKRRFKDNYQLSTRRARVIANALRDLLNLTPSQVTIEGRGPDEPIANNATAQGRKANRRVHLNIYSDKQTVPEAIVTKKTIPQPSSQISVVTQGTHSTQNESSSLPLKKTTKSSTAQPVAFDSQWLGQQSIGTEWLIPKADSLPQLATTHVAIKHLSDHTITLFINGQPVPKQNFEGTLNDPRGVAISRWRGIDLHNGSNTLEAIIQDAQGNETARLRRTQHLSTDPAKAELILAQSKLTADGVQTPVIAIRLLDKDGFPVRNGTRGQFHILPPYQAAIKQAANQARFNTKAMQGAMPERQTYQVTQEGIAFITLNPTTESGEVRLSLPFTNHRTETLTVPLTANTKSWILVGLAEGTVGYETLKEKSLPLTKDATQSDLYQNNRIAFFAKGKIQGKWLMTIAYDSAKKRPRNADPELFQTIDPDTYYTLYGDTGYNGYAASSSEKLYLKLEKDQFYFLFGDYQTALNQTQLSQYNRTLTGIKSRYQDERYDVILFSSRTNQAFVKDEFRGKSVTGPYILTRNNLAMNSEKVIVETRDRWRSERILSTTELTRHRDYQIDYQTGELYFRTPVYSTDFDLNPQYVIVKYESFDAGDSQLTYGTHAQVAINDKLTLGTTHINEGRTGGQATLSGLNVGYQATKAIKLSLEAAQTVDNKRTTADTSGNSYLAEVEHQTTRSKTKLYLRDQDQEFGLGQTNASENGLRKMGVDTAIQVNEHITLKGQAYQQESNSITRRVFEAEGQSRFGDTEIKLGGRSINDQRDTQPNNGTQQLTAGIRQHLLNQKLTLSLQREQNINDNTTVDFPSRTKLGADYRVAPKTSVFIEQDITDSALNNTRNTLIGIKTSPWNGGELYSGITQSSNAQGGSTSSNISARQTWQLNEQWRLEFGVEEVNVLDGNLTSVQNEQTPFVASITDEFTAGSLGVAYFPGDWMWTARAETHNGTREDRWQLATSLQTSPSTRLSTLTTLAFSNSQQSNGHLTKEGAIRLGLAYRPFITAQQNTAGNWLFLNKLDLKGRETSGRPQADNDWRIINNFNANYKHHRWQLSLQYAAKTVNKTLNNKRYSSFTDLAGFETRYDITPKWDIGVHGNLLRSVSLNQYDYHTGVSIGRTLAKNMWVSLGYNLTGFHDEDFSPSRNTNEGLFLRFRVKFDQSTVSDAIQWVGQ